MVNKYTVTVRANHLERTLTVQAPTTELAEWIAVHAFEQAFTGMLGETVKATDHDMALSVVYRRTPDE